MNIKDLPEKYREQAKAQLNKQKDKNKKKLDYPMVVAIMRPLLSLNDFTKHPKESLLRGAERAEFIKELWALQLFNIQYPPVTQNVTITRCYTGGDRQFDEGNLAGGNVKQLVDAMTFCGFWRDDSPKYINLTFKEKKMDKGLPMVLIEISLEEAK